MKRDIENRDDIVKLVNAFYERVRHNNDLAPIFQSKIMDWQPHLEIMYRFWNAALFNVWEYSGNPLMKHMSLPLHQHHFETWINLFYQTIDDMFEGEVASEAKRKAMIMANTFYARMSIQHDLKPLPIL